MPKKLKLSCLLIGTLIISCQSIAGTINSVEIIERSMSQNCLDWKIAGACFWLKCSLFGCWVTTTPKISHRLPDLTVSSYSQTFMNPWSEARKITSSVAKSANSLLSGGNLSGVGSGMQHTDSTFFYEVDVIGSPAVSILKFNQFLCQSKVKPFVPYYLSAIDAKAWRTGEPDSYRPEALTPGIREIGNWPNSTWGPVYPRSGFVLQSDPAKAAAVTAQRAIDIVLNDGNGHIFKPVDASATQNILRGNVAARSKPECEDSGGSWGQMDGKESKYGCRQQIWHQWNPNSNEQSDNWQMLLPRNDNKCEAFGATGNWSRGKIAEDGNYVWNYWRDYSCCIKGGSVLLKVVDF